MKKTYVQFLATTNETTVTLTLPLDSFYIEHSINRTYANLVLFNVNESHNSKYAISLGTAKFLERQMGIYLSKETKET